MKLILPILAGLALVACKSEPVDSNSNTTDPASTTDSAPKAQTVALAVEGMT